MIRAKTPTPRRHSVYVVELDPVVLSIKRFRARNPDYVEGRACLYVGVTGLTPEERLEKHRAGWKANTYVRRHGKWLRRRLYERYNPMTYAEAQRREVELAQALRKRGYAVWQG